MKNRILFITSFLAAQATAGLGQAGFEQYYYLQEKETLALMPILYIQSRTNWYAEARYNYEDQNTFALYGGRKFSKDIGALTCSLTPMVGGVYGRLKGGSIGLYTLLEYDRFYFSSQSQFTFSFSNDNADFIYDWSELGYEVLPWFYFGCSIQHEFSTRLKETTIEPGVVLGFNFGKWTFPVYGFNISDKNRYFILGINRSIDVTKPGQ